MKRSKKKREKKKPWLNERETLSYEQQIVDNNRQLARLRSRNEQLEIEADKLKQKLRQLEEDRSDVIAHLKRSLEERIEEARELNEQLSALEELRKEEKEEFQKKESAMELEYRTMESNLSAEVKLAAGKLSALEDWRLARLDLMHKFEVQEEQLAEQEARHKNMLYEAEKALIIGKAKMQEEMQERLDDLADKVRSATQIRIADATHRAIKENVALNQELDAMFEVCNDLEKKNSEYKDNNRITRLESDLFKAEAKIVMNKALKQQKLLEKLAHDYSAMSFSYTKLEHTYNKLVEQQKLLEEYKNKHIDNEKQIQDLQQNIAEIKEQEKHVLKDVRVKCQEFDRLNNILTEVKDAVMDAIQLQEESTINGCTCHHVGIKDKLLRSLFDILTKQNISNKKITERIMNKAECQYVSGRMGLLKGLVCDDDTEGKVGAQYSEEEIHGEDEHEKDTHKEEKDLEDTHDDKKGLESPVEQLPEKIPSCVLSVISSEILSPQETESVETTESIKSEQENDA